MRMTGDEPLRTAEGFFVGRGYTYAPFCRNPPKSQKGYRPIFCTPNPLAKRVILQDWTAAAKIQGQIDTKLNAAKEGDHE